MSKTALKKYLKTLTKEQIIEFIIEMYDNNKQARTYLEHFLSPLEEGGLLLEKYKQVIKREFNVENPMSAKCSFSTCRKLISEFASLKPSEELLADLMLTLPESACEFTYNYGDMSEQFYNSAVNNFIRALEFMRKNELLEKFKIRCTKCVECASVCGYGFGDEMSELFYNHYGENAKFTNKYNEKYE